VRLRLRGFSGGFLAGLVLTGAVWVWIVHLRLSYEIVVIAERTIGSVYTEHGPLSLVFRPSNAQIRPPSDPDGRLLLLGGLRSFLPFTTVVIWIAPGGAEDWRYETVHLEMPLFARSCAAIVVLGTARTQVGPCRAWRVR
jgi:hypothetical protein